MLGPSSVGALISLPFQPVDRRQGHHVIGFETYKKRCEEEYHAWQWALEQMRRVGVEPDAKVLKTAAHAPASQRALFFTLLAAFLVLLLPLDTHDSPTNV